MTDLPKLKECYATGRRLSDGAEFHAKWHVSVELPDEFARERALKSLHAFAQDNGGFEYEVVGTEINTVYDVVKISAGLTKMY